MQINPAGRITGPGDNYLPALDGLRFTAAILVAGGHYASNLSQGILSETLMSFTGLGMTLFFVLSGFVIHYNYHATIPRNGGIRIFAVARFARLYPLYFILFLIDFSYTGIAAHGACGRAGEPNGHWLGLISYLTLTQSWYYAVICKMSLVYQYGPVAAVSWSISVEAFFYIVYVGVARLIAQKKWSIQRVICFSAASYATVVVYLLLCSHFQPEIDRVGSVVFGPVASTEAGYRDSLLRWLLYFNPVARLSEFFVGMAAAHLYLAERPRQARPQPAQASVVTFAFVVAAIAIHLWLYAVVAPGSPFIGRIASPLYGPVIAIMMYMIARYDTFFARAFSNSIMVRFGEASYSIYLLHEILPSVFSRLDFIGTNQWSRWLIWSGSLLLLVIVSRMSYLYIERPARLAIRTWLTPKLVQRARFT